MSWSRPSTTTTVVDVVPEPQTPLRRPPGRLGWVLVAVVAAVAGALAGYGAAGIRSDPRTEPFAPNTSRIAEPQDVQGILAKVLPAVVSIRTQGFQGSFLGITRVEGAGSGFIVSADGDVLTNNHVVQGAAEIEVNVYGDSKPRTATVRGRDPVHDVALLKIEGASGLPTVPLGDSDRIRVGDDVVAIGYPLALSGGPTVTRGIISATDRSLPPQGGERLEGLLQTDAAINPGNSGGPLVDADGEVVGMNTAVIQSTENGAALAQNIGFAIAANRLRPIIDQLRETGHAAAGAAFLGVSVATLTDDVAAQYGLRAEGGALVTAVGPGSPGAAAGLLPGDVITRLGETEVDSAQDLLAALERHRPGESVEVRVARGAVTQSLTVALAARPTGAGGS